MTADPSAAADDDLAIDLSIEICRHGGPSVCADCARAGSRLVPVVRRYADAQVAAERERIAAAIEARRDDGTWNVGGQVVLEIAARIARGQP